MLDKIKSAATHKIGPLPIWAYVIIGGGMVLFLKMRKPSSGSGSDQFVAANPAQNARGGSDPITVPERPPANPPDVPIGYPIIDPVGPPIFIDPPRGTTPGNNSVGGQPGTGQSKVGVGSSAADLAKEPAGGWVVPPIFQQVSPTKVIDTSGGKDRPGNTGAVNPNNTFLGYANPVTGALESTPNGGPAIWR